MGGTGSIFSGRNRSINNTSTTRNINNDINSDLHSVGAGSEAADVFITEPYVPNSLTNLRNQHSHPHNRSNNSVISGGSGSSARSDSSASNEESRLDVVNIQRLSHQLEISSNRTGGNSSSFRSVNSNPPSNTVTPRPNDPLTLTASSPTYPSSIPYTPNADEARVFRYYCPLCMLYFRQILKMKCCGNYTCQQCATDYLTAKGIAVPSSSEADNIVPSSDVTPCPHCQISGFIPVQVSFEEAVRDYSSRSNAISHNQPHYEPLHSPLRVGESFEDLKRKMIPYQSIAITTVLTSSPAAHGFQSPNSIITPRSAYDDVIIVDSTIGSPQQSYHTPAVSGNGSRSHTPENEVQRQSSLQSSGPFNSSGRIEVLGIAMLDNADQSSPAAIDTQQLGDDRELPFTGDVQLVVHQNDQHQQSGRNITADHTAMIPPEGHHNSPAANVNSGSGSNYAEPKLNTVPYTHQAIDFVGGVMQSAMEKTVPLQ